jgi:hypothetical protein
MIIQTGKSILAYSGTASTPVQRQNNPPPLSSNNEATKTTDTVNWSDTAKTLAALENNAAPKTAPARTPRQTEIIHLVRSEPASAAKKVEEMAYSPSWISYDVSHGDLRLSSTGQIVDENYHNNFEKNAAAVDAQIRSLYETEKRKGTDPADILGKMIDFKNAQSTEYREATYWGYH